uniref:Uncharacterized protein n=1 Tax=Arion vulgaris TaxID=1028688 RepID=A0A0B7AR28_9EUPU
MAKWSNFALHSEGREFEFELRHSIFFWDVFAPEIPRIVDEVHTFGNTLGRGSAMSAERGSNYIGTSCRETPSYMGKYGGIVKPLSGNKF